MSQVVELCYTYGTRACNGQDPLQRTLQLPQRSSSPRGYIHVAVCCSVLQCVVVCCSGLQCVVVCCSVLQCIVVCCSVLQQTRPSPMISSNPQLFSSCRGYSHIAMFCSMLNMLQQCVAVCCGVAVCCSVLQRTRPTETISLKPPTC